MRTVGDVFGIPRETVRRAGILPYFCSVDVEIHSGRGSRSHIRRQSDVLPHSRIGSRSREENAEIIDRHVDRRRGCRVARSVARDSREDTWPVAGSVGIPRFAIDAAGSRLHLQTHIQISHFKLDSGDAAAGILRSGGDIERSIHLTSIWERDSDGRCRAIGDDTELRCDGVTITCRIVCGVCGYIDGDRTVSVWRDIESVLPGIHRDEIALGTVVYNNVAECESGDVLIE